MILPEPHAINRLRHALTRMETAIAGTAFLLLLALVFGQVLARNLFDSSIPGADILSRYLVLYVTFFGAALAIESHRHIRLDVVAAGLPDKWRDTLRGPLNQLSSVLCAVLAWAAWRFWYDDWQYVAEHERWSSILALITPFGFCLLALNFLITGLFIATPGDERR